MYKSKRISCFWGHYYFAIKESYMKKIIRLSLVYCILLFRVLWNYDNSLKLKAIFNYLYSIWLSFEFSFCGKSVSFKRPIFLRGQDCIKIGDNSSFHKGVVLTAWKEYECYLYTPQIVIGNYCNIGEYNHITAINRIIIGNGVLTGRWVTITDNSHGKTDYKSLQNRPANRKLYSKGAVIIGDNVWIGDKVTILPNVKIGEGAVIAANTVVTKDIPPYSVAVGNPVRIINHN